jgi:glycosyltransferase involved in cell wall biosynthesis
VLAEAGSNTILWVFSPRADYLVERALPSIRLAVYDCMDDLASFRDGTQELREREARLFELVDLAFTGGHSMYEARKHRHPRIYCFPSGVDAEHYRSVADPATQEPPAIATIPHPRLGYFGVLDERIDWELIATIAEARPAWHWTLVGPTAKVELDALPTGPNIHYLGQQQYADLPAFLKGFDIATMPFALNEATKYISPTKTLEYLAGGKPVISSSVPDVVASYAEIVHIADGPEEWIRGIEQLLAEPRKSRMQGRARAADVLDHSSWDSIAEQMWALMEEQLRQRPAVRNA